MPPYPPATRVRHALKVPAPVLPPGWFCQLHRQARKPPPLGPVPVGQRERLLVAQRPLQIRLSARTTAKPTDPANLAANLPAPMAPSAGRAPPLGLASAMPGDRVVRVAPFAPRVREVRWACPRASAPVVAGPQPASAPEAACIRPAAETEAPRVVQFPKLRMLSTDRPVVAPSRPVARHEAVQHPTAQRAPVALESVASEAPPPPVSVA